MDNIKDMCDMSQRHSDRIKRLINTNKELRFQAWMGWLMFIISVVFNLLNNNG